MTGNSIYLDAFVFHQLGVYTRTDEQMLCVVRRVSCLCHGEGCGLQWGVWSTVVVLRWNCCCCGDEDEECVGGGGGGDNLVLRICVSSSSDLNLRIVT